MTRPRGGQIWRRHKDGSYWKIWWRRSFNPMGEVRPHSDMRWTQVLAVSEGGGSIFVKHETDWLTDFEFVPKSEWIGLDLDF